jgi:hypothetical protein
LLFVVRIITKYIINTLWSNIEFRLLKQVVHAVTTGL